MTALVPVANFLHNTPLNPKGRPHMHGRAMWPGLTLAIRHSQAMTVDLVCECPPNIPHSAVIPPSTNSRAPVT